MYLTTIDNSFFDYSNCYSWHKAIWQLFPDIEAKKAPFLFRLDTKAALVQSDIKPTFNGFKQIEIIEYEPNLSGEILFKLRANPTKKIRDKVNPNRKIRVPLISVRQIENWLTRKLIGVDIINLKIGETASIFFKKKDISGKIVTVDYSGRIKVREPSIFNNILNLGVGPAKRFGCGLILIK